MIATDTLMEEAKCFTCLGLSQADALKIALLDRIAQGGMTPVGPPVTITTLGTLESGADANNYATGVQSPTANRLVLAVVMNTKAVAPDVPVPAGNGLTWVPAIASTIIAGATSVRFTVFRAMGAAPTPGAFSVTFGGATQIGCLIACCEFGNVDTSGTDGSGAITQISQLSAATANPTINLAAFNPDGRNMGVCVSGNIRNPYGGAPELGWNNWVNITHLVPSRGMFGTWKASNTDNSVTITSIAIAWHMVAMEIKASA